MHSTIATHHFTPQARYKKLETLKPLIEQTLYEQKAAEILGKEALSSFVERMMHCMQVYYKLVGVTDEVIAGEGSVEARGVLPRYTESLIAYFQNLQNIQPDNKEIKILEYSGVTSMKIRYKYTDSVIKKLIKLGLRNPEILDEPLRLFLKGGMLHDLIGMLFICSTPYEKEWVARAMYNFFEYDYRTDDHLVYGFYTVERKSGYRGLHCDHTVFDPRFDAAFSEDEAANEDEETIFTLLHEDDDTVTVLKKLKSYFNIEIQLHTAFENLWSSLEHRNSYNIQAKGAGRSSEITAQWRLLSDNMQNLQMQFERLQIDTEQAQFKEPDKEGYRFIGYIFETLGAESKDAYMLYRRYQKEVSDLEALFTAREISRQDYVEQIFAVVVSLDSFADAQKNPTVYVLFKLGSAFIHFSLANHQEFFNAYDLHRFVEKSLEYYSDIHDYISTHEEVFKGNMIYIISILRYLQLAQKYGYGLIDLKDVVFTYSTTPAVSYTDAALMFESGISLMNRLGEEDLASLYYDVGTYIRVVYRFEVLAQEWELFRADVTEESGSKIAEEIALFRKKFMHVSLLEQFENLLDVDKITNVGFVVRFYALMVWHSICPPNHALKQIIKYSAYDKIMTSDILSYELAAYRFFVVKRCEDISDCQLDTEDRTHEVEKIKHYKKYHKNNMIQQLFRIYRDESIYDFHKMRLHFEKLTQSTFKINHFSDKIDEQAR